MRYLASAIGAAALVGLSALPAIAAPSLAGPINDGAVLQRGETVWLNGTAEVGSTVTIRFAGETLSATASVSGAWQAELPAMTAGGPYTLSLSDSTGETAIPNLLVGDVLLCSGQSNMEYPVYRALNPDAVMGAATDGRLRLLTVPQTTALTPQDTLPKGAEWTAAAPDTVRDFSAVCYLTGKALRETEAVPVGLIDSSWGGSQIEAWLPAETLQANGLFPQELKQVALSGSDPAAAMQAFGDQWEAWWQAAYSAAPWSGAGDGPGWKPVPAPGFQDWKEYGDPDAANHLGYVWFGTSFDLTADQAGSPASLSLGLFDDTDAVWLNGEFLGSTSSWSDLRTYDVPDGLLKAGTNTITINVLNTYGAGGMRGPAEAVVLTLDGAADVPLAEGWSYRVEPEQKPNGPRPPWESVTGFTTIHNAMLAPLAGYPMAGAIWYQGESNTGRGGAYEQLLTLLTANWRAHFGADLPIVIVQLPGFGAMPTEPVESGWSQVREAERQVALAEDMTGLAVTIDAGDRTDIHPPNKQVVAARVFDVLSSLMGKTDSIEDGIAPTSIRVDGSAVVLSYPGVGLKSVGGTPIAFETCVNGTCSWADAALDGATIRLAIDPATPPTEIRYCQGDAPLCNVFSANDVPAAPFRESLD